MPLDLKIAILTALDNLYDWSPMCFDYWLSELFTDSNQPIVENWTPETLRLMEKDVQVMIENPA